MHGMEYFFDSLKIQSFHIWSFNPTEVADKRSFTCSSTSLPIAIIVHSYIYIFCLSFNNISIQNDS